MPRTYKRRKPCLAYSVEDVTQAVQDVKDGKLSQRGAAVKYGVPKTVFQERVCGKVSLDTFGSGRPRALTVKEEQDIEDCNIARAHFGYPCDRRELLSLVGEYVKTNRPGEKTQFADGNPGEDWYLGFMKRHLRLSLKKPEYLQKLRKDATNPDVVFDFYDKLEAVYREEELTEPTKACFVFNADESGFSSDPSRVRGIGQKGTTLSRVSGGSGKESTTVLACVSADGAVLPPMFVFKGAAVQARWTSENAYPGTLYSTSTNGWMEGPQFYSWFCACFIPHVTKVRELKSLPEQAVVLIFDGHSSHMSLRICSEAVKNNVTHFRLPSHLTDKLQPLDKCVFGPVITSWDIRLVEHGKSNMGQKTVRLSKCMFVQLLGEVWQTTMTAGNIISGFRSTGVYPVDSNRFPEHAFNPLDLKKYKEKQLSEACPVPFHSSTRDPCENRDLSIEPNFIHPTPTNLQPPSRLCPNSPSPIQAPHHSTVPVDLQEPLPLPSTSTNPPNLNTNYLSANRPKLTSAQSKNKKTCTSPTLHSVIEVFAETLTRSHVHEPDDAVQKAQPERTVTPRLKIMRYGEVLTTRAVMERMEEAEAAKVKKKSRPTKERTKKQKVAAEALSRPNEEEARDKSAQMTHAVKNINSSKLRFQHTASNSSSEDELSDLDVSADSSSDLDVELPEVDYLAPTNENVIPGKYVLITLVEGARKSTRYTYACCVQQVISNDDGFEDEIVVMSLKCEGLSSEFSVVENDVFTVSRDQILSVLPEPKLFEKDR